jgi:hypothetical protein
LSAAAHQGRLNRCQETAQKEADSPAVQMLRKRVLSMSMQRLRCPDSSAAAAHQRVGARLMWLNAATATLLNAGASSLLLVQAASPRGRVITLTGQLRTKRHARREEDGRMRHFHTLRSVSSIHTRSGGAAQRGPDGGRSRRRRQNRRRRRDERWRCGIIDVPCTLSAWPGWSGGRGDVSKVKASRNHLSTKRNFCFVNRRVLRISPVHE